MAFGLEARVPFLDQEILNFSARLPMNFKFRNGQKKYLLRKLVEKKFSVHLASQKKLGFSVPIRDWLRGDLKYLLDEYLSPQKVAQGEILNPRRVESLIREHTDMRANHSHLL